MPVTAALIHILSNKRMLPEKIRKKTCAYYEIEFLIPFEILEKVAVSRVVSSFTVHYSMQMSNITLLIV